MHVLVIPSAYPTEDKPLSSIFYKEQSMALQEKGIKVGVIYSETRNLGCINIKNIKRNYFQVNKYIEDKIITYRKHGWNIYTMRGKVGINLWIKQTCELYEKYIETEGKPDIIHAHSGLYGGIAAATIKKKYGIPYVITEHSSGILKDIIRRHDIDLINETYNDADALISVGTSLKNAMNKYTDNDITVIPNIVDVERFSLKDNKAKSSFTFITICNLKESKGLKELIEAFALEFKADKNVKLNIIGDGEYKDTLINIIESFDVKSQIKLLGQIGREDIAKYIKNSSAFVLPSWYETFGISYIEALACGLPIITTNCGGPEDFFNEDLGYMIPLNNLEELRKALRKMVNNINEFNSENIREFVKSKFSKEIIVKQIEEVYEKVLLERK